MFRKIITEIEKIPKISRITILIGVGTGLALLCAAVGVGFVGNMGLAAKYRSEQMAKTAVTIFAQGVFLGLGTDFLLKALDRKGK